MAFFLAAGLTAAIWALSIPLTGKDEAWDAEGYYFAALPITGAISGALIPKHFVAHYLGAIAGQVAYEVIFLASGALFILGLAFMAAYAVIFLGAAAAGAALRTRSAPVAGLPPTRE